MPFLITGGLGSDGTGSFSALLTTMGLGQPGGEPAGDFLVESASPLGPALVAVRFSKIPKAWNPAGVDDATNPANYSLSGPAAATVVVAQFVPEDPFLIYLFTDVPLEPGVWTLDASEAIETPLGTPLTAPGQAEFLVTQIGAQTPLDGGAENDGGAEALRTYLNPALEGPAWDALLAAIGSGDDTNSENARLAADQLYLVSASGQFLDRRAGEVGVRRPDKVGMGDGDFRRLGLALANDRVTHKALNDVLEVFYSMDATRAATTTGASEPFELRDNDTLTLLFGESREVTVTFRREDFGRIALATAAEVVAAVNRALTSAGVRAVAVTTADPSTGDVYVRLYADARGLGSTVRVTGGRAQVALRFPLELFPGIVGPFGSWDVDASPDTQSRVRFTSQGTSAYDLSLVQEGDYVLVYGQEFDEDLRGTYEVTRVSVTYPGGVLDQWFEVDRLSFTQLGVTQYGANSLVFFRPTLNTLHDQARQAVVTQAPSDRLEVVLPVTTQVVVRGPKRAAYPKVADAVEVDQVSRALGIVTVETVGPHGLEEGDMVIVDGVRFGPDLPPVSAGTDSGSPGTQVI